MDERQRKEIEIFNAALELYPGAELHAYLDQACRDEPVLRQKVETLLRVEVDAEDFFHEVKDTGQAQDAASPNVSPKTVLTLLTEVPGTLIGRYKLLERIGEGGCGVVYMAEQVEPIRRRVALKVIKLGMDTKQVVARFDAERQALALMDHPNIAKVLDAGSTETGRPYFVMELVRGVKITNYCDENRLPTDERLDLFVQVCHAIQHAHQKGIIHRDIKPSNILVSLNDGVRVPKVIDFGIAKAIGRQLTDKTVFTAFEQFIGTPAYMSPEQAQMTSLDIDTRGDIYALGVLLYELLTGHTPFDQKELVAAGLNEMRRIIAEQEPIRPSTCLSTLADPERTTVAKRRSSEPPQLIHQLRGDLDWIVMKCLEKDRNRRYETANGLADDVKRHREDQPVLARPPGVAYRLRKLIRRNKLAFAAGTTVVAALIIGLGFSFWSLSKERQARFRAVAAETKSQAAARESQQVAQFLKDMLKGVGPSVAMGRDTTMLKEILDKTAERVGRDLKGQPEVEAELRSTLGDVYFALAQYTNAATMHRAALTIRRALWGNLNTNVADSLDGLGRAVQWQAWQTDQAEPLFQEALSIRTNLLGVEHPKVADSLLNLGYVRLWQSRSADAERFFRQALAIRRRTGTNDLDVARTLNALSYVLCVRGEYAEAERVVREALAIQTALSAPEPVWGADPAQVRLGTALFFQHKLDEAEVVLRQAVACYRKAPGTELMGTFEALVLLSSVLVEKGEATEAERVAREAFLMSKRLYGDRNPPTAASLNALGCALRKGGNLAEAETAFREELAIWQALSIAPAKKEEVLAQSLLNAVLREQGKPAEEKAP